jgi:hypothetical protein
MLTVHILPPTHELIAARDEAMAAESSSIEEVMVIIDNGHVGGVYTPPCRGTRFESDDLWIRNAIIGAYENGVVDGQHGPKPLCAPAGWVLWSTLRAGDIATSGQGWVAISDTQEFKFANGGCNARRFAHVEIGGDNQVDERFNFDPAQWRSWPFYRVARAGLTGAQILDLLDAVTAAPADETVQQVIDRVLPVGA